MRLARRSVLIGAAACLAGTPARAGDFAYRDWRFNTSAVKGPLSDPLIASLQAQIELVERVPLRAEVLRFFRGFDVKVDPATLGKSALYRSETARGSRSSMRLPSKPQRGASVNRIYLSTQPVPADSPVFLRILLLAYLDRRVPEGWDNPRVSDWLEEAKRTRAFSNLTEPMQTSAFASRSEMMHSPEEFFANTVGAVLNGRWPVEPLERARVRDKLPGFYAWIVSEFIADGASLP